MRLSTYVVFAIKTVDLNYNISLTDFSKFASNLSLRSFDAISPFNFSHSLLDFENVTLVSVKR